METSYKQVPWFTQEDSGRRYEISVSYAPLAGWAYMDKYYTIDPYHLPHQRSTQQMDQAAASCQITSTCTSSIR